MVTGIDCFHVYKMFVMSMICLYLLTKSSGWKSYNRDFFHFTFIEFLNNSTNLVSFELIQIIIRWMHVVLKKRTYFVIFTQYIIFWTQVNKKREEPAYCTG